MKDIQMIDRQIDRYRYKDRQKMAERKLSHVIMQNVVKEST